MSIVHHIHIIKRSWRSYTYVLAQLPERCTNIPCPTPPSLACMYVLHAYFSMHNATQTRSAYATIQYQSYPHQVKWIRILHAQRRFNHGYEKWNATKIPANISSQRTPSSTRSYTSQQITAVRYAKMTTNCLVELLPTGEILPGAARATVEVQVRHCTTYM